MANVSQVHNKLVFKNQTKYDQNSIQIKLKNNIPKSNGNVKYFTRFSQ